MEGAQVEECVYDREEQKQSRPELQQTSLRSSKHALAGAKELPSLVFPLMQTSKKQPVVFCFLGLCFCFIFVLQKEPEKHSGSGETFMSAGKTKPRLTALAACPPAAPNHRAGTLLFQETPAKSKIA